MNGTHFGYTPLLWDGEGWCEAYGFLGRWYKTYGIARSGINFLVSTYPEKYQAWKIERITIDDDNFVVGNSVTIAQSKNAAP